MLKPLLAPDPVDSSTKPSQTPAPANQPPPADRQAASPPAAAETVANGKSEREAQLERENIKLRAAVKKTADNKRKVEMANIKLAAENQDLKQIHTPAKQPATTAEPAKKRSWGFFSE